MSYTTVTYEVGDDHVAVVTLNRPEVLNAWNAEMCRELSKVWREAREDDAVHAVVVQAAGDRAFCTGVDRKEPLERPDNVWNFDSPGRMISPKHNQMWKPVVCAVQGMAAGGAFYLINESDIVVCSPDATFFDPHVSYGIVAALEPIGLSRRVPLGEVLRMALLGLDERMSATRAREIGLVSEVVEGGRLHERARELAAKIAAKPPAATQGTVRAIWDALDREREAALTSAVVYTQLGNPLGRAQLEGDPFASGPRPAFELR